MLLMAIRFSPFFFCSPGRVFLFANILIKVLELVFMDEIGPCHFQCKGVL